MVREKSPFSVYTERAQYGAHFSDIGPISEVREKSPTYMHIDRERKRESEGESARTRARARKRGRKRERERERE